MLRPFELDPQIIHHIIHHQAGSIGKAMIELIMNSVDADARLIKITMTSEGFKCEDDGNGFANLDDVINYFGRFGTPHQEGDATYGRFRLGRGQIMAHAYTTWMSNMFNMNVDTKQMGYNYDLTELDKPQPGCLIDGTWYEKLTESELMSTLQEIRDLVRYTPACVELNGKTITRDPAAEKWDYEDDYAYYRVRLEGAVSIYNQGVLVRHDSSHLWGAGGLIVSKQALSLNVSRTEILRKTCEVWNAIAKKFQPLVDNITDHLISKRKTEARREKSARSLLSAEGDILETFNHEEVITLANNRHVTLDYFLRRLNYEYNLKCCVVENDYDVPKAETMARTRLAMFVHPKTMYRFGAYTPGQFLEALETIFENIRQYRQSHDINYGRSFDEKITLIDYRLLSDSFIETLEILKEKDALDRETLRAWTALRWCLQQYAGACLGKRVRGDLALRYGEDKFEMFVGTSNTADAWTDGSTYVAFNIDIIKKLKRDPIKTASYIFSLLEHEIAHEGDSLGAGHDEAFYQRYHDISLHMSSEKQRYMHKWLMKYTYSLEYETNKTSGNAWRERYLIDRVGTGREKKGLGTPIEDVSNDPIVLAHVPNENAIMIDLINSGFSVRGLQPDPSELQRILEESVYTPNTVEQEEETYDEADAFLEELFRQQEEVREVERSRVAALIGIENNSSNDFVLDDLSYLEDEEILQIWKSCYVEVNGRYEFIMDRKAQAENLEDPTENSEPDIFRVIEEKYHHLIQEGENLWSIERNAAAAGFFRIPDYLIWRSGE
ncbi:DNA mismatch repair protein MutL [Paenibacillus sp. Root52]|uniref:ATP-binding protein n=1 Tax=Paenibacillus sp. Root52 TaxID=1736552 RepID=UPI0007008812|nr:ATP-binding protein [Paenibacillus sp. Root52]KQY90972.1 DNA mismatch repair protein MutL [Paenibacillus sp. Root52]